jgi:hypothetical protein
MADETIVEIKVRDEQFKRFAEEFERYAKRLEESHAIWGKIAQAAEEARAHLRTANAAMDGGARERDTGAGGKAAKSAQDVERSFTRTHQNVRGIDQVFRTWDRYAQRGGWLYALSDVFGLTAGGHGGAINPFMRFMRDPSLLGQTISRGLGGYAAGRAVGAVTKGAAAAEGGTVTAAAEGAAVGSMASLVRGLLMNPYVQAAIAVAAGAAATVSSSFKIAEDRRKALGAGLSPSQMLALNTVGAPFFGPEGMRDMATNLATARYGGVSQQRMTLDAILGSHDISAAWLKANRPSELTALTMTRTREFLMRQPEEMRLHVAQDFGMDKYFGGVDKIIEMLTMSDKEFAKRVGEVKSGDALAKTGLGTTADTATEKITDLSVAAGKASAELYWFANIIPKGVGAGILTPVFNAADVTTWRGPFKPDVPVGEPGTPGYGLPSADPGNQGMPRNPLRLPGRTDKPSPGIFGQAAATPGPTMAAMGFANDSTSEWMKKWFSQESQYTRDVARAAEQRDQHIVDLLNWLEKREDKSDKVDQDLLELIAQLKGQQGGGGGAGAGGGGGGGGFGAFLKTGQIAGASPVVGVAAGGAGRIDTSGPGTGPTKDKADFLAKAWPLAQKVSQQTGVDARVVMAQAALESNWGKSAPGGNYFGIKGAGGPGLLTKEFVPGQGLVSTSASFAQHGSMEASFQAYADLINKSPRYAGMKGGDLQSQIAALGASGYATDPNYASKISGIASGLSAPSGISAPSATGGPGATIAGGLSRGATGSDQSKAVDDLCTMMGVNDGTGREALKQYLGPNANGLDPHTSAWCAMTVNAALAHAGIQGTGSAAAASFAKWGAAVDPSQVSKGDVAEYKSGAHVGLLTGATRGTGTGEEVQLIAGNEFYSRQGAGAGRSQVGQVGTHWMKASDLNIRRAAGQPGGVTGGPLSDASPASSGGGGGWGPQSGGGQIASNMCGCGGGGGPGFSGGGGGFGSLLGGMIGGGRGGLIGGLLGNLFGAMQQHGPMSLGHPNAPQHPAGRGVRLTMNNNIGADIAVAGSLLGAAQG